MFFFFAKHFFTRIIWRTDDDEINFFFFLMKGLPWHTNEFSVTDELRSILFAIIISTGCSVFEVGTYDGRLSRICSLCDVSKSSALRAIFESRISAIVKRIERASAAKRWQSRRFALLQIHESCQRRTRWREVREHLFLVRSGTRRSESPTKPSDAGDLSRHWQTSAGAQIMNLKIDVRWYDSNDRKRGTKKGANLNGSSMRLEEIMLATDRKFRETHRAGSSLEFFFKLWETYFLVQIF